MKYYKNYYGKKKKWTLTDWLKSRMNRAEKRITKIGNSSPDNYPQNNWEEIKEVYNFKIKKKKKEVRAYAQKK